MNRTEVITEISQISGVAPEDCDKVINALEQVLNRELESSKGIKNAFGKIYKLMSIFKNN